MNQEDFRSFAQRHLKERLQLYRTPALLNELHSRFSQPENPLEPKDLLAVSLSERGLCKRQESHQIAENLKSDSIALKVAAHSR